MIGFGNEPNLVFALTFRQCCREVPARRRHGGLGISPASAFVIQMLCLRQRRHRRRWYLKGADNTPYEKIGDEVRSLADLAPFEIPSSWEWCRVGDLFSNMSGLAYKKDALAIKADKMVRVLRGGNIGEEQFYFKGDDVFISSELVKPELYLRKNYMITPAVSSLDHIGKIALIDKDYSDTVVGGFVLMLIPHFNDDVVSEYLFYAFAAKHHRDNCRNITHKSGQAFYNLSREQMMNLPVPIPPREEMGRIIAMLKRVLPRVADYAVADTALQNLNGSFPEALKKSILQEAVQGKLVPQDPSDEPAEALLERIRVEKQRLIKEGKIKKDKHESVIFRRDNSHYEKRGSKEENINDIIPFELPDSWEWIRLSAILTSTDAGKSPQCENRPRTIGEWGVIKTTAIQDGYFLAEENKVLPLDFDLQESMVVHHGDLLITRAGPRNRTGVICVVDGEPENLILSDKTVRLSYLRNFVNPHYVMTALSSPAMQYFVVDAMTGMASSQVNISQEKMKTFLLPLPPLNEQQRIVDEVSKIFGRIDKLNF